MARPPRGRDTSRARARRIRPASRSNLSSGRPSAESLAAHLDRHVEQQRQVGTEVAAGSAARARDAFGRHAVAAALVGVRRVGEAIADDPVACVERGARSRARRCSRRAANISSASVSRAPSARAAAARAAARRAACRPARASPRRGGPRASSDCREPRQMRALAGAVDAFERDEAAAG